MKHINTTNILQQINMKYYICRAGLNSCRYASISSKISFHKPENFGDDVVRQDEVVPFWKCVTYCPLMHSTQREDPYPSPFQKHMIYNVNAIWHSSVLLWCTNSKKSLTVTKEDSWTLNCIPKLRPQYKSHMTSRVHGAADWYSVRDTDVQLRQSYSSINVYTSCMVTDWSLRSLQQCEH